MAKLLKPVSDQVRTRTLRARIPGCTVHRNTHQWCRRICLPHEGLGTCGRAAPHAMLSQIQQAILEQRRRAG